ncbi:MAG: winged helix DNA-binding domain-containing protein [Gordonia sp. (in: high G+C Gram-positive bacteria)]|uniref:winged helix DNA-binding domain-containing protein n=1 Tax=Gordonia sp. (in: high G+C Gram-positive bacteria) TaxID=84139 RepID=UPI0039E33719
MISVEQWNRTLLARQHLLERIDEDVIEVLDRCVGLQAQDPAPPFFALWSRIEGFDPADYDELLTEREVVRSVVLRGTLMALDAHDARWMRALVQPRIDAVTRTNHKLPADVDAAAVVDFGREQIAGTELAGSSLRDALAQRWPSVPAADLMAVVRDGLHLVQVPPRGTWRGSGQPTYALLDDWIGPGEPAVDGDEARKDLVRMYLRGFGPASVAGIQTWSGLTGLGKLVEAMEADWELAKLDGPNGEVLYDLDGLPIVDGDTPAPVRLVAPFDHILVAQAPADRIRIADPDVFAKTVTPNGRSPGFVLVDGRLAGTWRLTDGRVGVDYLVDVPAAQRRQVDQEALRLEAFASS